MCVRKQLLQLRKFCSFPPCHTYTLTHTHLHPLTTHTFTPPLPLPLSSITLHTITLTPSHTRTRLYTHTHTHTHTYQQPLQIKSVVAKEGIKGYIYVEAFKQQHVKQTIQDIRNLSIGKWKQLMVPIKEMTDVLRVFKDTAALKRGSWVRIRRGMYRDDVAQVGPGWSGFFVCFVFGGLRVFCLFVFWSFYLFIYLFIPAVNTVDTHTLLFINPRHACAARVTVVVPCLCVCS